MNCAGAQFEYCFYLLVIISMMRMIMTIINPAPINQRKAGISPEGGVGVGDPVVTKDMTAPLTERPPAVGFNATERQ